MIYYKYILPEWNKETFQVCNKYCWITLWFKFVMFQIIILIVFSQNKHRNNKKYFSIQTILLLLYKQKLFPSKMNKYMW